MHGLHVQKSYHLIWNLKIMIWSLITRTDRSLDVGNNKVFACGSQSWSLCLRLRNILKRGLTDSNDSNSNNSKFWFKCSQTWVGSFSCNGIHIRYVTYVRTVYTILYTVYCILYTVYCLLYYILYTVYWQTTADSNMHPAKRQSLSHHKLNEVPPKTCDSSA